MTLMGKELVNALLKVVGFLWVLRFPPIEKVDRVGWRLGLAPLTDRSTAAVLRDRT
jgi:hypothetical protein